MTKREPTITVVIPCFNGAAFLADTLRSALGQTYLPLEVLVVDDGSTDDSAAIAESFGPPVRVIRQVNQGESVARNRGIDEAQGEWIAFLDADDRWEPEKLKKQVEAIDSETVAVCTGNVKVHRTTGESTSHIPQQEWFSAQWICRNMSPCHISTLLVQRDLPARFPTWTRYGEDCIYLLELLQHGKIAIVAEPLAEYTFHGANQSSNPQTVLRWRESIERWIEQQEGSLGKDKAERLRAALLQWLIWNGEMAYYRRDWKCYDAIAGYLEEVRERPEAARVLPRRKYPKWIYSIKDWFESAVMKP